MHRKKQLYKATPTKCKLMLTTTIATHKAHYFNTRRTLTLDCTKIWNKRFQRTKYNSKYLPSILVNETEKKQQIYCVALNVLRQGCHSSHRSVVKKYVPIYIYKPLRQAAFKIITREFTSWFWAGTYLDHLEYQHNQKTAHSTKF